MSKKLGSWILAFFAMISLSSTSFAASPEVERALQKLENMVNNNLPSNYRSGLNNALAELRVAINESPSCEKSVVCRATSTALQNVVGVGSPASSQLEAEASARDNCRAKARFPSDCDYIKLSCEKDVPGQKLVCQSVSRALRTDMGTGKPSEFKILAEESAREACLRNHHGQGDCELIEFRCENVR